MPEEVMCDSCRERPAMHEESSWWKDPPGRLLCCRCYIKEGGDPADWHDECMEAYKELRKKV